jgi:hypothetical protein
LAIKLDLKMDFNLKETAAIIFKSGNSFCSWMELLSCTSQPAWQQGAPGKERQDYFI